MVLKNSTEHAETLFIALLVDVVNYLQLINDLTVMFFAIICHSFLHICGIFENDRTSL